MKKQQGIGVKSTKNQGISEAGRHDETQGLILLVQEAAELIRSRGEAGFADFRISGSRWKQDERYVFVLDRAGNMLVHVDPELEGKNQLLLKDISGKPIIRGLLDAATAFSDKPEGWYHYQWPVPGGLFPRWKSSCVRLVKAPSGQSYIVGSGMYNDRMEREFVVDLVQSAIRKIGKEGKAAFDLFRDPVGPFIVKDAYIFVIDMQGVELVNPAFPNLEGRNLLDLKDTQGRFPIRDMFRVVQANGSGWVDYMWPKPGESVSTQKSAYVCKAKAGDETVLVGCGAYLANAPQSIAPAKKMIAPKLMELVHEAAAVLEERGEEAFVDLRKQGSKWFGNDIYFFVFSMDGTRTFHAAEPETEGRNDLELRDILGRPIVRMILEVASKPGGQGWIHYMYPEPGGIFPVWKSSYVRRVTFPSGKDFMVGCGIYNLQMDKSMIEDLVDHAAAQVARHGKKAFGQLRDKTGPFIFMDTYVFVQSTDGTELVNPILPNLEGRNLMDLRDLQGKAVIRDQIAAALREDNVWLECYWYRPGTNEPAPKQTYVMKVQSGEETYVVGSGLYEGLSVPGK